MLGLRAGSAIAKSFRSFGVVIIIVLFFSRWAHADVEPTIRVRLQTVDGVMSLSGMGLRFSGMSQTDFGYRAVRISAEPVAGEMTEWKIVDRDNPMAVVKVKARLLQVSGESLRMNLHPVPGKLSFVPMGRHVGVVAEMGLESYVRGVLPAEMPRGWPVEALKAQAVAARTFALHRKALASHVTFDVEASVMDQMYEFSTSSELESHVARAVSETRGIVLVTPGSRALPLAAYYHADCGGRTENAKVVWGSSGAGTAVDNGCPLNPLAQWKFEISRQEMARRLRQVLAQVGDRELSEVVALGRNASGRVAHLRLQWGDMSVEMSAPEFRMALGHDRLRSTNFSLKTEGDKLIFVGKGFGHGVGLCQWGARNMAVKGNDYQAILKHYYPQSVLSSLKSTAGAGGSVARY